MKRSGSSDKDQTRLKKRAQTQEELRSAKVKLEKRGCSRNQKPTCVTCGKRNYGECLKGTRSSFRCVKEGHKVKDCPTNASIGREDKSLLLIFKKGMSQMQRLVCMHSGKEDQIRMRIMMIIFVSNSSLFSDMSSF